MKEQLKEVFKQKDIAIKGSSILKLIRFTRREIMLTERIIRLNDKVRNTQPTIDLDRARLITEFYSKPSMDNYILRRAKAFKYYLENKKIFIDEDSQIAGHVGDHIQAVHLYPEITKWLSLCLT